MKRNLTYLIVVLSVIMLFGGYQLFKYAGVQTYKYVIKTNKQVKNIEDGVYKASYKAFNVLPLAKVEYKMVNGKPVSFHIHYLLESPFNKIKEEILKQINHKESIHFDAVTGATRTSYFVKAAINKAVVSKKETPKSN